LWSQKYSLRLLTTEELNDDCAGDMYPVFVATTGINKEGFDTLSWHWYGTECRLDQLPDLTQETPYQGGVARKRRRDLIGINRAAGGKLLVPHFSIPQVKI